MPSCIQSASYMAACCLDMEKLRWGWSLEMMRRTASRSLLLL
jgi:hypothetical protein